MTKTGKVKITKDGPYMVSGDLPLLEQTIGVDDQGLSVEWLVTREFEVKPSYALCRCGHSAKKPFCDGTHAKVGFNGAETASRQLYDSTAELLRGPRLSLSDEESLCAFGRFCDPNGRVWNEVQKTEDPEVARTFVPQVNRCHSGRLVAWDNESGRPLEQPRKQQVSVVQDPAEQCSGPIWVEGGVEIEGADGSTYELRNRVTLCRCGQSQNKPFCDGTHASIKFSDKS